MKRLLFILLFLPLLVYPQAEKISNGDFVSGSTDWTVFGGGYSIADGVASYDGSSTTTLRQTSSDMVSVLENSKSYIVKFDITTTADDDYAWIRIYSSDQSDIYKAFAAYYDGSHTLFINTDESTDGGIGFYTYNVGDAFDIDNISVKELVTAEDDPYFVATDGDDANNGSIGSPWATFGRAIFTATPGDTVYFRGGIYYKGKWEDWILNPDAGYGVNGERGNPITYMTYPGDMVDTDTTWLISNGDTTYRLGNMAVFDCRYQNTPQPDTVGIEADPATASPLTVEGISCLSDHIVFKNLVIRNLYQKRRYIQATGFNMSYANNITMDGCVLYNVSGHGFYYDPWWSSDGKDSSVFINNDAFSCCDSFSINVYNYRDSYGAPNAGSWGNGFFIITVNRAYDEDTNSYVQFLNNRAWRNADEGVNLSSTGTVYAQGNWSFANGYYLLHDVYDHRTSGNGWKVNAGNYPAQLDSNYVQYYFYNNIAAFNMEYGYGENNNGRLQRNREVYNNTMYGNSYGYQVLNPGPAYDPALSKNKYVNNVAYNNRYGPITSNATDYMWESTTNSWDDPPGATLTDDDFFILDSTAAVTELKAPRALDGSLPEITFLKLASGSDLIDAGTDVGLDYNGTAPDLGYSEYGDDTIPLAAFSADNTTVCKEDSVQFSDASTNTPLTWAWSFPSGSPDTSNLQNPKIEYPTAGTYTVSLYVTNADSSDTETKTNYITVRDSVVADFSASETSVNTGANISFTDLTTNNPSSWSWTFAGGTPSVSTSQNPTIQYNTAGTYTVTLEATNTCNSDTEQKVGYITVSNPYAPAGSYRLTITFR